MRIALLLLFLACGTAAAQPGPDAPARAGDRALLFNVEGINLQAFEGGVGVKWWTGDSRALWAGLGLTLGGEETEGEGERRTGMQSTALSVGVEFHGLSARRVSPFVSVEGGAGFARSTLRDTQGLMPGAPARESAQTRFSLGGGVGMGVEARLLDWLSLSGSQRLLGQVYRRTAVRPYAEDLTSTGYFIRTGGPRLTLAAYF